mmetsp:Transcript_135825/g.192123  ORF Transcript_135825/g.192123 Transcript_135825/m.192123 type:complete len:108 (-) Transcript_135825:36-359(-)|eukprot:symbB.v1.2.020305.t1/scaffold1701.1/size126048/5
MAQVRSRVLPVLVLLCLVAATWPRAFLAPREARVAAVAVASAAPQAAQAAEIPNIFDPNFNFDEWLLTPEADEITVPTVIIGSIVILYGLLWIFDRLTEGPNAPGSS